MSLLDTTMQRLDQLLEQKLTRRDAFRAIVGSVDSTTGMVTIRRLGTDTAETELRAVIGVDAPAAGDEVLALPVNGKPAVVGRVRRAHRGDQAAFDVRWWGTFDPSASAATNGATLDAALADLDPSGAGLQSGGTLHLPPGAFEVTGDHLVPLRTRLLGAGQADAFGGTLLQLADSANPTAVLATDDDSGADWWHYGEIGHLSIDGNTANNTSGIGIDAGQMGETSLIHNVYVYGCASDGIKVGPGTPCNLAWISSFDNDGYGFNIVAGIASGYTSGSVTLLAPSGDNNALGLLRVTQPNAGGLGSVTVVGIKGERANAASGTHEPAILLEDFTGCLTLVGGSLNGFGTSPSNGTNAITRDSDSDNGDVIVQGLRITGYTTQFNDASTHGADVSSGSTDTTTLWLNASRAGGVRGSASLPGGSVADGGTTSVWVSTPDIAQDWYVDVAFDVALVPDWRWWAEPLLDSGSWYVQVVFLNDSGASATLPSGTVYARATPRS